MKKLLTFLLLITAFTSSAQVYQRDPSYGRSIDRYQVLKALHIPTTSGVPNLSDDVITNTSAIAYDSTGHKFYVYDPSTETWGQVTGGGIVIDPGVDSITYHNNQLCQWVSGVSTCYFLNKFYDSTALNFDSTKILHFNSGNLVDSVLIPTGTIHIIQDGAGETNIVRVEDSTRLHFPTLKNSDDITPSKNADSSISFNFTVPHYTKDQVDSIAATLTASGITRAELIDTADNKVNKTDVSGGTINQVLKKNSSTDYDWSWQDESGGGKDSSAYHTIQALGDTALVICDLQGRCDTTIFSAHTVWSKNGNYAYYNSGNVGIGTNTPPSLLTLLKPTSNAVPDDSLGLSLQTSTDATSGNPTASLPLVFGTKAWVTSASASQDAKFKIYARGNNGSATGNLYIDFSGNGAAYTNAITIAQNGNLTTNNITAGTISGSGISGNSFTVSRNVNNGSSFTDNTTFIAPSSFTTYRSFYYNPTWTTSSIVGIDVRAFDNTIGNNVFNRTRGSTSIGTDSVVVGAKLAVTSTTSAFLPPRMTKVQRDSIYSGFTGSITNPGTAGTSANATVIRALTGGSGSGAEASITIVSNQVTSVTITKYGSGYAAGDVLSASIGSITGFTWTISAITPPKAGSVIYQTDNTPGIRVFNGTNWMKFTETAD